MVNSSLVPKGGKHSPPDGHLLCAAGQGSERKCHTMSKSFNGLGMSLGNLSRLSDAETRSISAENPTGAKGQGAMATEGTGADAARELGQGWKVSPCITVPGGSTVVLADITGPGAIQHIWITVKPEHWRWLVLRMYWDEEETPSVEVPLGDLFCGGWCVRCNVNSLPVAVNPAGGFNSYWEMPFRSRARVTLENLSPAEVRGFFYQIDYALTEVEADRGYFHAQWRRSNPLPYAQVHTLLDGVSGQGHYVGTYIAWGVNNNGWWGPAPKTTSEAPGASSIPPDSMASTPHLTWGCHR